jgi:hypothetical protein
MPLTVVQPNRQSIGPGLVAGKRSLGKSWGVDLEVLWARVSLNQPFTRTLAA